MDRGAWRGTVRGVPKVLETTQQLNSNRFLRILQLHFYCLNCINSFLFGVVLFGLVLNTRIKYGTGQVKIEFGLATVALICSEGHDCMKFCLHDVYLVIRCPFSFN